MSIQHDHAYLLFRREQGETSLWLSMLTSQYGRIQLVYKGGKKKMQSCPAFNALYISWQDGKQTGGWLRQCETIHYHQALTGMCNWAGLYANEWLHRSLLPEVPQPQLYIAYESLLTWLRQTGDNRTLIAAALRCFEWTLIHELGYGLPLQTEQQQPLIAEAYYQWQAHGWVQSTTGICGADILALAQQDVLALKHPGRALRELLQGRLSASLPNQQVSMRHWWEQLP